jgi:hypothetical protein
VRVTVNFGVAFTSLILCQDWGYTFKYLVPLLGRDEVTLSHTREDGI